MNAEQLLPSHSDAILARIEELGLDGFRSRILESAYSVYRLIGATQTDTEGLGTTRFGGHPDLPASFDTDELEDFEFVYQVNCADLPDAAVLGMPSEGILSVFSDSDPYDGGKSLYFPSRDLVRHQMPDPDPDFIFAEIKPWTLEVSTGVDFAQYGADPVDDIEEAGLSDQYERLIETEFDTASGPCVGELLGRHSELNGDMRNDAAEECGGDPSEWRSLWKVLSSYDSGLVISDFHLLHGMIRRRHLEALEFGEIYTVQDNG